MEIRIDKKLDKAMSLLVDWLIDYKNDYCEVTDDRVLQLDSELIEKLEQRPPSVGISMSHFHDIADTLEFLNTNKSKEVLAEVKLKDWSSSSLIKIELVDNLYEMKKERDDQEELELK